MTVAFLGLGEMGQRMARRLLDHGHALTVYNRTPARAAGLIDAGAAHAATPREAVAGAEVVFAMLEDDAASEAVWTHAQTGAVIGLASGSVAVECSTLTPAWARTLAARTEARGALFLDAPVVGTLPHAGQGGLAFLVGGADAARARVQPLLDAMGSATHACGAVGHGMAMKLAVNALFAAQAALLAELLAGLDAQGIGPAQAAETLKALPITSPAAARVLDLMRAGAPATNFPLRLVSKDARYAADALGQTPGLLAALGDVYAASVEGGHGAADIAAIGRLYEG